MKLNGHIMKLMPIFLLLLFSCAPKAALPSITPPPPLPTIQPGNPSGSYWREDWEKTLAAARKEGRLSVHTGGTSASTRDTMVRVVREKFGIEMEFLSGRAAELAQKVLSERRAGLFLVDLNLRGPVTALNVLKPAGALERLEPVLILPEVLDPKVWLGDSLNWVDKEHYALYFLAYPSGQLGFNTAMVRAEEVSSWRDLLNPKWKGKMLLQDPTLTGTRWFQVMASSIMKIEYLQELAKNEPVILRDQRLMVEWLARGKYPLLIDPPTAEFEEFFKVGTPIAQKTPKEGSYLTGGAGGLALFNRAPHPNAAKVFINWLLTKEGQTVFSQASGSPSSRLDVTTEFINPWSLREPGIQYLDVRSEEVVMQGIDYLETARQVFGHLIK